MFFIYACRSLGFNITQTCLPGSLWSRTWRISASFPAAFYMKNRLTPCLSPQGRWLIPFIALCLKSSVKTTDAFLQIVLILIMNNRLLGVIHFAGPISITYVNLGFSLTPELTEPPLTFYPFVPNRSAY